jgi:hypothetical protein
MKAILAAFDCSLNAASVSSRLRWSFHAAISRKTWPIFVMVMAVLGVGFTTFRWIHGAHRNCLRQLDDRPSLKEQVTLPVTGILTCAVLLVSMGSQLPDIGYTVAIESVFYVFFALCLMAILSAFVGERLQHAKRNSLAIVLNRSARTVYVLTMVATVAAF